MLLASYVQRSIRVTKRENKCIVIREKGESGKGVTLLLSRKEGLAISKNKIHHWKVPPLNVLFSWSNKTLVHSPLPWWAHCCYQPYKFCWEGWGVLHHWPEFSLGKGQPGTMLPHLWSNLLRGTWSFWNNLTKVRELWWCGSVRKREKSETRRDYTSRNQSHGLNLFKIEEDITGHRFGQLYPSWP